MKNNPLITTRLQKKTYILSIDFANVWVELFCKRVGWKLHFLQTSGSKMARWMVTRLQSVVCGDKKN